MMNRREFIAATGRRAAATAALATPLLATAAATGSDLHDRLAAQLEATRAALGARLDAFATEMRSLGGRVQRLEFQQQLLLYLLLLSFILDGGLTWLVLHTPVLALA
jgi:hypothetical protein